MSTTEGIALDRDGDRAGRRLRPARPTSSRIPEHLRDALWKVESAGLEPWDSPGGLIVAGMGGSAIGGELARADPRRPRLAPARSPRAPTGCRRGRRRTRPSSARATPGNTEETLACYEAAGALGARRVVVTTGGELAELARADGVPVIPLAGGFQPRAAVALHDRRRARGRRAVRRRAADELGDRRRRRPPRGARRSSGGPDGADDGAGQDARARRCTAPCR